MSSVSEIWAFWRRFLKFRPGSLSKASIVIRQRVSLSLPLRLAYYLLISAKKSCQNFGPYFFWAMYSIHAWIRSHMFGGISSGKM